MANDPEAAVRAMQQGLKFAEVALGQSLQAPDLAPAPQAPPSLLERTPPEEEGGQDSVTP